MSPDQRQHRGAHPADRRLFDAEHLPRLSAATYELSWLLGQGYASKSALKLVGDRHSLNERQRLAVSRAACSDIQRASRAARRLDAPAVRGEPLMLDGFNLIITLEAALGGGLLLLCRDDCIRDLSSVHGSYRSVLETERAILLVGAALEALAPARVKWLLDRPISNSGRLAARIKELAAQRGWLWSVEVVFNPDAEIIASDDIAVSSDSSVLDGASRWFNLTRHLIPESLPQAWILNLRDDRAAQV